MSDNTAPIIDVPAEIVAPAAEVLAAAPVPAAPAEQAEVTSEPAAPAEPEPELTPEQQAARQRQTELLAQLGAQSIDQAAGLLVNIAATNGQPFVSFMDLANSETQELMGKAMVFAIATKEPGVIERLQGALAVVLNPNPNPAADAPRIIRP